MILFHIFPLWPLILPPILLTVLRIHEPLNSIVDGSIPFFYSSHHRRHDDHDSFPACLPARFILYSSLKTKTSNEREQGGREKVLTTVSRENKRTKEFQERRVSRISQPLLYFFPKKSFYCLSLSLSFQTTVFAFPFHSLIKRDFFILKKLFVSTSFPSHFLNHLLERRILGHFS